VDRAIVFDSRPFKTAGLLHGRFHYGIMKTIVSPLRRHCSRRASNVAPAAVANQCRSFISLSSLFTSASESSIKAYEVSDAEIHALARRKQHPLSLADLIKYDFPQIPNFILVASSDLT
jgi:hypothetical protein